MVSFRMNRCDCGTLRLSEGVQKVYVNEKAFAAIKEGGQAASQTVRKTWETYGKIWKTTEKHGKHMDQMLFISGKTL